MMDTTHKYRESPYNQMTLAIAFLDSLAIDSPLNALWWCLHQVVWHHGIDRVHWLLDNKELVIAISKCKDFPSKELMPLFKQSIIEQKNRFKY